MNRRLIIIVIILLLAGGFAAWFWYFKPVENPNPITQNNNAQPQIISSVAAISPVSSHDGNKIWYGTSKGVLKRYELATNQEIEYAAPKPPGDMVTELIWPIIGDDLIFSTLEGAQTRYQYFNSATQTYTSLPSSIIHLDWLNDGRRILYTWRTVTGKIQLVMANSDGTGYKKIADVPWDDLVPLASPTDNTAILYRPNAEGPLNKIYLFDLETGHYTELVNDGWATGAKWTPDGQKVVVSMQEQGISKLYIYDLATKTKTPTNIVGGVSQTAVSQDSVWLYAVSAKAIVKYNIQTGEQSVYHEFPDIVSAKTLLVLGQEVYYLGFDGMIRSVQK